MGCPRPLRSFKDTASVSGVEISADGRCIASGRMTGNTLSRSVIYDKTIIIWDAKDGGVVLTLEGHTGNVYFIALTPEGMILASCSIDSTIRLFNLDDKLEMEIFESRNNYVTGSTSPHQVILQ